MWILHSRIIRYFNAEEKESALRNAFFTSVALTLSTIIYGRTPGGLSIVDGLIVTFLPYTISTGAENNTLALIQGKATLKFAYILHLAFCAAFGLLVWVNVDTYGTTPGCNLNSSAKFVVFGHSVGATSKGLRGFGIFAFALTAVVLPLAVLRLAVLQRPAVGDGGDHNGDHEDDTGYSTFLGWFWTIFLLSIWVYEVVTIEEILRRNALDYATHQWSFGQTLALTMVLSPAFDFASAVLRSL